MVECDGLCAMDKAEAFAEAMGHIREDMDASVGCDGYVRRRGQILWEGRIICEGDILWGQMGRITTIGLRTECILSDGIWNPILQNLCGKSWLMSIIRYNCV